MQEGGDGHMDKSVRQKEFADRLTIWNCKRSLRSGMVLAILFPILGVLNFFLSKNEAMAYWGVLLAEELVQLAALWFFRRGAETDKRDRLAVMYKAYYVLTVLGILVMSVFEYRTSESLLLLVGVMSYYVSVPALSQKEQRLSGYGILVLAVPYCIAVSDLGIRAVVDSAVILSAAAVLGRFSQNNMRYKEKLKSELMEKTISAEHDVLTGLMNRLGLEKQIEFLWPYCARANVPVGVIEIDIDFFKKYNDKFGHPEGDICLKKVAGVLQESARRSSDIAVRTGGEEFLVFVQNMTEKEIIKFALRIRDKVEELKIPHAWDEISKYVTVSMGAAYIYPNSTNNFHQLYEHADKALYKAKRNGRNCVVFGNLVYGKKKDEMEAIPCKPSEQ